MITFLVSVALAATPSSVVVQATPAPAAADVQAMSKFVRALEAGEQKTVAGMIKYPFEREKPLSRLESADDFLKVYDSYFDKNSISKIVKSAREPFLKNDQLGTHNGEIWFDNAHVIAINLRTGKFDKELEAVKKGETLFKSAQGYDELLIDCSTSKTHVRIEKFGKALKYFAWAAGAKLSEKPQHELTGKVTFEGTANNAYYEFKTGETVFELDAPNVCGDDYDPNLKKCRSTLSVIEADKNLGAEDCK